MPYILLIQRLFFDALRENPFASQFSGLNRYDMKAYAAPRVAKKKPKKMLQKHFGGVRYNFCREDAAHFHCWNRQRYENESGSFQVWIESQFVIKVFRFDSQHFYTGEVSQLSGEVQSRDFHRKCQRLCYWISVMNSTTEERNKEATTEKCSFNWCLTGLCW